MGLARALVGGLLAVALLTSGSPARGTVFHVETTLSITMLMKNFEMPAIELSGTGVATIQANGTNIQSLRLDGAGITHASVIVPITDPVAGMTVVSLRGISVSVGSGTLSPIDDSGSLVANVLPVRGRFLVCILMVGCQSNIPFLTAANATSGIGIGGFSSPSRATATEDSSSRSRQIRGRSRRRRSPAGPATICSSISFTASSTDPRRTRPARPGTTAWSSL